VRVRVVVVATLALVAVASAAVLSQRAPRLAGTNAIKHQHFVVELPPGRRACQDHTLLVDDAARVELLVGTYGRPVPPLAVAFTGADGAPLARGRGGGGPEGHVVVPLDREIDGTRSARLCVRNGGATNIALAGDLANPDAAAHVGRDAADGAIAVRYLRRRDETWWELLPTLATRFGYGKAAVLGWWTLPAAALALLAVWAVTIRLLLRAVR